MEAQRKLVSVEEAEAEIHTARARALQEECQVELNRALPALHGDCLLVPLVFVQKLSYSKTTRMISQVLFSVFLV